VLKKLRKLLQIYADSSPTSESECLVRSLLFMYKELECEQIAETVFAEQTIKVKCNTVISRKGNFGALLDEMEKLVANCPIILVTAPQLNGNKSKNYPVVLTLLINFLIMTSKKARSTPGQLAQ